jgi:DinB superfamily
MPCPICQREHPQTLPQALGVLARTPTLLEILANRTAPARLARRPAPDKWSAKETIGHLADCEWVFGVRYRKIVAEPGAPLPAFEQDAWATRLGHEKAPVRSLLAAFAALRGANVALLKSLPAEAWTQAGQHPSYGALRLQDLILHIATHDASHLARLEDLCPEPVQPTSKKAATRKHKPAARRK